MKLTVLVPFDFSAAAEKALASPARLVRGGGEDGAVTLMHVLPVLSPIAVPSPIVPAVVTAEDVQRMRAQLAESARRHELADAAVDVVVAPSIGAAIVARADEMRADLIAMGTHGRSALGRLVLGSVADYVVRHAPCPVLTVRG